MQLRTIDDRGLISRTIDKGTNAASESAKKLGSALSDAAKNTPPDYLQFY